MPFLYSFHEISGLGEQHEPETHLIPLACKAALGKGKDLMIYGQDYETIHGTCIRDYIHVTDLCGAHLLSLNYLNKNTGFTDFNLGNGTGFSVIEVMNAVKKVAADSGKKLVYQRGDRRGGDPAILISDSQKARKNLGWIPKFDDIDDIVTHAWNWEFSLTK